jgi:hypothetical protein
MQDTYDTKREPERDPGVAAPAPQPTGLPFEYEDRSDGSHERALEELKAAWLWTQSRRARGLLPN